MRKYFAALCLTLLTITSTGCESKTAFGECRGLADMADKDPNLEYRLSVRNIIVSAIFFELAFVPPLYVALEEYECPVGRKDKN